MSSDYQRSNRVASDSERYQIIHTYTINCTYKCTYDKVSFYTLISTNFIVLSPLWEKITLNEIVKRTFLLFCIGLNFELPPRQRFLSLSYFISLSSPLARNKVGEEKMKGKRSHPIKGCNHYATLSVIMFVMITRTGSTRFTEC